MHAKTKQIIRKISAIQIQGASQVRKAAVTCLLNESRHTKATTINEYRREIEKTAVALVQSRPTEPGLRTVVRIMLDGAFVFSSVSECRDQFQKKAGEYEKKRLENLKAISEIGSRLFSKKSVVLTHCHSHTVEAILTGARKKIDTVYCTETRPLFQGRITATNLSNAGLNVVQVVDSGSFSVLKECDFFMTGADAVLANGNVVNKVGTGLISLAAKRFATPHYVATSSYSFDPMNFFGWPEPIEQRSYKEVWDKKPKSVAIQNPAFDVTEAEFVSAIVSEKGIMAPQGFAEKMIAEMDLINHKKEFLEWMKQMNQIQPQKQKK